MHVEQRAAQTILQGGVPVEIPAPLCLRMLGKRTISITIYQPCLGTLIRMSELYVGTGITTSEFKNIELEAMIVLVKKYGKAFSKIIAIAYLNGYWSGKLLAPIVASLVRNLSPQKICALVTMLFAFSGADDFMTTIESVRNMKITEPNLSQQSQGS